MRRLKTSLSWLPVAARASCLMAALSCAVVQAQPIGIPSLGSASASELPPGLERTLGEAIMEQGRRDPTYIDDPDVSQYLTSLGRKLIASSPQGAGQPIEVFAIRDPRINAFAMPGGYIGVHSGLVVSSKNESELASVIAHEIGHVLQRHVARGMTQQTQSGHLMLASVAAALLAALASRSGDLAMGVAAFGQAAAVDRQLGFSRQAEQEADRVGFDMLRRAGFDPRGMTEMFAMLGNASRLNQGAGGGVYASTHPLSIQRQSDIENRLRELPKVRYHDSDSFWFVRAKLRVIQVRGNDREMLASLKQDTKSDSGVERAAAWFGLAYAAWMAKDYTGAASALDNAGKDGVRSAEMAGLQVALSLAQGKAEQGYDQASKAFQRWPDSQGVALALAEAMAKTGRSKEAVPFLKARARQWPDQPRFNQMLAQSYERLGDGVAARRAMADYYVEVGAVPTAVEQLTQARQLSKDFYIQSQLDVQIRQLRDKLRTNRELLERFAR